MRPSRWPCPPIYQGIVASARPAGIRRQPWSALRVLSALRRHRGLRFPRSCNGLASWCAQRLAASQRVADRRTGRHRNNSRVLNALRHHRGLRCTTIPSTSPRHCAQRLAASRMCVAKIIDGQTARPEQLRQGRIRHSAVDGSGGQDGRENDATGTLNARPIDDAPSLILIRSASIIVTTLKWGHDDVVVERVPNPGRSWQSAFSFNGATTMASWKGRWNRAPRFRRPRFNGATTMSSWKGCRSSGSTS